MNSKSRNRRCFLCFRPAEPKTEQNQNANHSRNQFLLLLLRHLQIQPQLPKFEKNFMCCEDCALLGESFCDLICQMDLINLQVEWKVRQVFETMICAGRVPSRVAAFRAQFETPLNEEDEDDSDDDDDDEPSQQIFKRIKEARKFLIKSCGLKLKSSQPRVLLKKISECESTESEEESERNSRGGQANLETVTDVDDDGFKVEISDPSYLSSCSPPDDESEGAGYDFETFGDPDEFLNGVNDYVVRNSVMAVADIQVEQTDEDIVIDDENILTENLNDLIKEEPNSPNPDSPQKPWRSLLKCDKCTEVFTKKGRLNDHLKLHEKNLIPDDKSNLDLGIVIKEEESGVVEEDEQENSGVDMEQCSEKVEELLPTENGDSSSLIKRRDPTLPFTQCEICLVNYDCEAAAEKCRVMNHQQKKYVCCHSCRRFFSCHYLLVRHRTLRKRCFTRNLKDLEPAAAPQFPRVKLAEIIGKRFCPVEGCYEVFRYKDWLNVHLKTHGNWKCLFCPSEFGKAHELAWHEVSEHSKTSVKEEPDSNKEASTMEVSKRKKKMAEKALSCTRCDNKYNVKGRIISHFLYNHLSIPKASSFEKVQIECEICKNPFGPTTTKKVRREHVKTHHDVEDMDPSEVWRCSICSAPFRLRKQRKIHVQLVHRKLPKYKCSHCGRSDFPSRRAFKLHNRRVEKCNPSDLVATFECGICKGHFGNEKLLEQHVKTHVDDETVEVPQQKPCKKTSSKRRKLVNNSKTVDEEPKCSWNCDQCENVFKTKALLDQHIGSLHSDPSQFKFFCPRKGCGRRFWSRQTLTKHIRTRKLELLFVCEYCGDKFWSRPCLRNHLAFVHGNEETAVDHYPIKTYVPACFTMM